MALRRDPAFIVSILTVFFLVLSVRACGICGGEGMGTNSEGSLFLSPANFEAELRLNRNLLLLVRTESYANIID